MAGELNISLPKAYEIIKKLEKEGIVRKSRIVSGTQLHILDEKDKKVKHLLKDIKGYLKLIVKEHSEKPKNYASVSGAGAASAKHF